MHYLGGKSLLSYRFAGIIDDALHRCGGNFIEPFVGAFNIVPHLDYALDAVCADIHPGLINLYKSMQEGFVPPSNVTLHQYNQLRRRGGSSALTTFVSFACSFAGKEWGGYARGIDDSGVPRNYSLQGKRALLSKLDRIRLCKFVCMSYDELPIPRSPHVYYCDPPYSGTTGYNRAIFDSGQFYLWCLKLAEAGHTVFVSEFTAPLGWEVVWSTRRTNGLDGTAVTDNLYRVSVG